MTNCPICFISSSDAFCPKCGGRMPVESTEVSSPLASIIRKAMESRADGPIAKQKEKLEKRMKGATKTKVILADISGSMEDYIGSTGKTKYDHLKYALNDILKTHSGLKVIAFHSLPMEWQPGTSLPTPTGGTDLAAAIQMAKQFKPCKTIIISDGLPDNRDAATREADSLTGSIDTIYCGPDGHEAIQYLRSLAHSCGGSSIAWDGARELSGQVKGLLGPATR